MTASDHLLRQPQARVGIADDAPKLGSITDYDQHHMLTYARILDADTEAVAWQEAARAILGYDVEQDPVGARRCWISHLERARWIVAEGYQQLLCEEPVISEADDSEG